MKVRACGLGAVLGVVFGICGFFFPNTLVILTVRFIISAMNNEVVLTPSDSYALQLCSSLYFSLVTDLGSDMPNSSPRQLDYCVPWHHNLQHWLLGIVSVLHVNTIPKVKGSADDRTEKEPVPLIVLPVSVTDSCGE